MQSREDLVAHILDQQRRIEPWWIGEQGGRQVELGFPEASGLGILQADGAAEPQLFSVQTTVRDLVRDGAVTDARCLLDLEWANGRARMAATVDVGQALVLAATDLTLAARTVGTSATARVMVAVNVTRGSIVTNQEITFTDARVLAGGAGPTAPWPVPLLATRLRLLADYLPAAPSTLLAEFGRDAAFTGGPIARQLTGGAGNGPWLVDVPREARFLRVVVTAATSVQPVWLLAI